MSDLPLGWVCTSLGTLCSPPQYGWTTSARREGVGSLKFLRTTDISRGNLDWSSVPFCAEEPPRPEQYALASGDIVISRAGSVGFSYRIVDPEPSVFASYLIRFRPTHEVDGRYISYFLQSHDYWRQIRLATSGITLANVNAKRLAAIRLPLAPGKEQERVVAAIEEQFSRIDVGMAAIERVRQKLKRMRSAVLQAAVTGRLVPQDPAEGDAENLLRKAIAERLKYINSHGRTVREPLQYLDEVLPDIPSSWRWASLDQLAEVVGGITKDAKKQSSSNLVEVPYLRVANVQRGFLDLNKVTTIRVSSEQRDALRLRRGDVLFNEGGDRDKLGRGWVWEGQIDPCIHQNHVFRARLYADVRLLSWHGNSFGQRWFIKGGKQTTNLASVSKTTLRSFPVPVPPLLEQARITTALERYLSLLDRLEAAAEAATRRSDRLRSSILAASFSGQLTSQDPSDEPASVLLERITDQRAASDGNKSGTKPSVRGPRHER